MWLYEKGYISLYINESRMDDVVVFDELQNDGSVLMNKSTCLFM